MEARADNNEVILGCHTHPNFERRDDDPPKTPIRKMPESLESPHSALLD
jgi:hypothetical protein